MSYSTTSASIPLSDITEDEAYQIGMEAYVYFYPLISMDVTRRVTTNYPVGEKIGMGPMNAFYHFRELPSVESKEVVRPNFDTLYSNAWLDLTQEPMIVTADDTGGRYYLLPMLDMWTDVFAVPGKRTSGTLAHQWAVVPQGWSGELPPGVERIEAPTPYVWIIGRTQTNGASDYDAVHRVQDGFTIVPLSQWGTQQPTPPEFVFDPDVDMETPPVVQVDTMPASEYFSYGVALMKANPPHVTDWSQIQRLQRIGIVPGMDFDFQSAPDAVKAGLERAVAGGFELMRQKAPTIARVANGWQMNTDTMGVYGNYYVKRAIIAQIGLGANQPEDAIYPLCLNDADGEPCVGSQNYVQHFNAEEIPPVDAFWSITMYDEMGFPVDNPLHRYNLNGNDPMQYNDDGSLDIYIQHQSPGADKESNWLPGPASGGIGLTMRLYAPRLEALDGRWNPPAVRKEPGSA